MSQKVKVKVQPGQTITFPAVCINCNDPAAESLRLRKRAGRLTRHIDAPLCADCAQKVQRLSGDEERWHKISWLLAGLGGLLTLAIVLLLIPAGVPLLLRFLAALAAALLIAWLLWQYGRRTALQHARPEKRAILNAARITTFSWRATTFEFENEPFAARFAALNEPRLMEI